MIVGVGEASNCIWEGAKLGLNDGMVVEGPAVDVKVGTLNVVLALGINDGNVEGKRLGFTDGS